MRSALLRQPTTTPDWFARHAALELRSTAPVEFIDVTDRLSTLVARSGISCGLLHLQTRHTTTGIVVNEHEPLLLEDLQEVLGRIAPAERRYRHDDLSRRTVNLVPNERRNGHAHGQALVLRASESVQIVDGAPWLGRWQRVFFVELDGPQRREMGVLLMGGA
jgi:secondary thiamine-phosphate synthase enzyme